MRIMKETDTNTEVDVANGFLQLKRKGVGFPWRIVRFERRLNRSTDALAERELRSLFLDIRPYEEMTFAESSHAAEFIRREVA